MQQAADIEPLNRLKKVNRCLACTGKGRYIWKRRQFRMRSITEETT
jgi:hypothetical protein